MRFTTATLFALVAAQTYASTSISFSPSSTSSAAAATSSVSCSDGCAQVGADALGCDLYDYACECKQFDAMYSIVIPCLETNSTCSAAEVTDLKTRVTSLCAQFSAPNGTVPSSSTSAVAKPTQAYYNPTATGMTYFTGAGMRVGASLAGVGVGLAAMLML